MVANSLDETNLRMSSECLSSRKSVYAGNSLLRQSAIIAGQIAALNSVVVMNLSLDKMWKRLFNTAAERLASLSTSVKAGITLRTSVFFSKLSMTFLTLVKN